MPPTNPDLLQGLPPIENPDACALILGSMPGGASLRAGRYYAHPQNLFWRFMGELVDAGPELTYEVRMERLRAAGIALWDVIATCEREGSLDSAIRSAVANDFGRFFATHPDCGRFCSTAPRRRPPSSARCPRRWCRPA